MKKLSPFTPHILGITRIVAGVMFASHGAQKLGAFGGVPAGTPAFVVWGAGLIELVAGLLIAAGLFTRPAAFLSSGTMAVAYFMAHGLQSFWPIQNGGELAVLYSWLFLYLAAEGPGAFALDNIWGRSAARDRVVPMTLTAA
jgi:putative oxidoreductase